MSNNQLWPSQMTSTTRATKSSFKAQPYKTDWMSGFTILLIVILMAATVAGGLYFLVLEPLFSQLQAVTGSLPHMELASTVGR